MFFYLFPFIWSLYSSGRVLGHLTLLDGGFNTQLEKYKDDFVDTKLWGAQHLKNSPETVMQVHMDFIRAGADIISTNTYQASIDGFVQNLNLSEEQSIELIKEAVKLARRAIADSGVKKDVKVAGSVGSYGAYLGGQEYRGEFIKKTPAQKIEEWHIDRIDALVKAGVDYLAFETMPSQVEGEILMKILKERYPEQKAWLSFTLKLNSNPPTLPTGESPAKVIKDIWGKYSHLNQLIAVGMNCALPSSCDAVIQELQGSGIPIIVYPNSGESFDHGWKENNRASQPVDHYVERWYNMGVRYVGGCCRVRSEDIEKLRGIVDEINSKI